MRLDVLVEDERRVAVAGARTVVRAVAPVIVVGQFEPVVVLRRDRQAGSRVPARVQNIALPVALILRLAREISATVCDQDALLDQIAHALVPLPARVKRPIGPARVTHLQLLGKLIP